MSGKEVNGCVILPLAKYPDGAVAVLAHDGTGVIKGALVPDGHELAGEATYDIKMESIEGTPYYSGEITSREGPARFSSSSYCKGYEALFGRAWYDEVPEA